MTSLDDIVKGKFTDKHTVHSYIPTYEEYFKDIRDSVKEVLEVGICEGGSILLWKEYFPNARVTGIDVNLLPLKTNIFNSRTRVIINNAYSDELISELSHTKYDVIIDDGPHTLESMKFFAQNYSRLLSDNGVLIIEDVQDVSWIDEIKESFPEEFRDKVKVVDLRNVKNRYDDILIILKK